MEVVVILGVVVVTVVEEIVIEVPIFVFLGKIIIEFLFDYLSIM